MKTYVRISITLKKFHPQQKAQAKIKIQQLLYEIEFPPRYTKKCHTTMNHYLVLLRHHIPMNHIIIDVVIIKVEDMDLMRVMLISFFVFVNNFKV